MFSFVVATSVSIQSVAVSRRTAVNSQFDESRCIQRPFTCLKWGKTRAWERKISPRVTSKITNQCKEIRILLAFPLRSEKYSLSFSTMCLCYIVGLCLSPVSISKKTVFFFKNDSFVAVLECTRAFSRFRPRFISQARKCSGHLVRWSIICAISHCGTVKAI